MDRDASVLIVRDRDASSQTTGSGCFNEFIGVIPVYRPTDEFVNQNSQLCGGDMVARRRSATDTAHRRADRVKFVPVPQQRLDRLSYAVFGSRAARLDGVANGIDICGPGRGEISAT